MFRAWPFNFLNLRIFQHTKKSGAQNVCGSFTFQHLKKLFQPFISISSKCHTSQDLILIDKGLMVTFFWQNFQKLLVR